MLSLNGERFSESPNRIGEKSFSSWSQLLRVGKVKWELYEREAKERVKTKKWKR